MWKAKERGVCWRSFKVSKFTEKYGRFVVSRKKIAKSELLNTLSREAGTRCLYLNNFAKI